MSKVPQGYLVASLCVTLFTAAALSIGASLPLIASHARKSELKAFGENASKYFNQGIEHMAKLSREGKIMSHYKGHDVVVEQGLKDGSVNLIVRCPPEIPSEQKVICNINVPKEEVDKSFMPKGLIL